MTALRFAWPILLGIAQPAMAQDAEVGSVANSQPAQPQSIGEIIRAEARKSVEERREQSLAMIDRNAAPEIYAANETMFRLLLAGLEQGYASDIAIAVPGPEDGSLLQAQSQVMTGDQGRGRHVWASVTKQIVATMVMQQVEDHRLALDSFVTSYLVLPPAGDLRPPTIRELLQHTSGLRDAEGGNEDISFYRADMTDSEREAWCLEGRKEAPRPEWQYNNCDYIVLGAVLETVSGQTFENLFAERIARPSNMRETVLWSSADSMDWERRGEPPEPDWLEGYGTAAALVGRTKDLLAFSVALLEGRLLGEEARAEMWRGVPALGYMALGQWSYAAALDGCTEPVHMVERRGEIGRYQALNLIFPDLDRALVLTNGVEGTDFGTIWAGEGLAYTLASILACGGIE